MALTFDTVELTELSDDELQRVQDESGKGKPPVYKAPMRDLLAFVGERQGSLPIRWNEINPNAKDRQTVITGVRNMLRTDEKNGSHFARIAGIRAETRDDYVVVLVKAAA